MFRISQTISDHLTESDRVDPAIRASRPGRFHVDQIERDPLPSGHTSRRWGVAIERKDGSVAIERDPWEV
jgi:hypothetical protein